MNRAPLAAVRLAGDRPTEWLTAQDLANELRIPVQTIYRWRMYQQGPVGRTVGRHLRWAREDVNAWLDEQAKPKSSR